MMALNATSSHFLNTSRDGDFTTSLGRPFQRLIRPFVKKFLLPPNLNLVWRSLRLCPPALSLVAWEKKLMLTWLQPPASQLFSGLNNLSD